MNRKSFLKLAASGSVSALFGLAGGLPRIWNKAGLSLITVQRQSLVMGSVASFTVVAETEQAGNEAIRKAVKVFREMDRIFSMYRNDSEMAKLAKKSGQEPLILSEDAYLLLREAKQLYKATGGLFDITIEPAMRRWGFRHGDGSIIEEPTNDELKKLEQLIGMDKLIIEGNKALLKTKGMAIDTGGIAGGYALNKAIASMKKCDIAAAFINFSGDIHCFGEPEKGSGWPVQIFNPHTRAPISEKIKLFSEALSTSGAYQNRRIGNNDQSWGHLLKPKSAQPVEPVASLTAIHPSAMVADAWSTAAYVGAVPPETIKTVLIH